MEVQAEIVKKAVESPEIYIELFIGIAEKFGFAAAVSLILTLFLMWMVY